MATSAGLSVILPPELEEKVLAAVARGEYASPSEAVREGLRLLLERDRERATIERLREVVLKGTDPGPPPGVSAEEWESKKAYVLGALRKKIQEGFDSLRRGEGVPGDQVIEEFKERSRRLRAERA